MLRPVVFLLAAALLTTSLELRAQSYDDVEEEEATDKERAAKEKAAKQNAFCLAAFSLAALSLSVASSSSTSSYDCALSSNEVVRRAAASRNTTGRSMVAA